MHIHVMYTDACVDFNSISTVYTMYMYTVHHTWKLYMHIHIHRYICVYTLYSCTRCYDHLLVEGTNLTSPMATLYLSTKLAKHVYHACLLYHWEHLRSTQLMHLTVTCTFTAAVCN